MEVLELPLNRVCETDFETLYEDCFPAVALFVSKMQGSLEDAKDLFHDALVIYHEKNSEENLEIRVSTQAYIVGIAKHLWIRKFKDDRKKVSLDHIDFITIPADYFPAVNANRLLTLLESTGTKCLELLRAFYYQRLSVKDLIERFGYSTEHSASVQKYKCIEKARETLKQKSISYEDFLE
jgi:RNA polymerase sigma factor (sigma-70 family)